MKSLYLQDADLKKAGELKIGELSKKTKVSIESIRFYEQRGVIPCPIRKPSGYRLYTLDFVDRLLAIKWMRNVGFSLDEIKELLTVFDHKGALTSELNEKVRKSMVEIEYRVKDLQKMKRQLQRIIESLN